jgi:AcrR family transcriptional regulator
MDTAPIDEPVDIMSLLTNNHLVKIASALRAPGGAAAVDRAERRKAESRERLLQAARRLFIERGYHATRPQDIAREADVGHGTFYLHFADKRECFLAFAEHACAELQAFVNDRLAGIEGVEPQLRALLESLLDYAEQNPGAIKAAMTDVSVIASDGAVRESLIDRWAAQWASRLRSGAEAGAIHGDYDAEVAGHAIVGLIRGAASYGLRGGAGRAELVDTVARFLARALISTDATETARHHLLLRGRSEP